MLAEYNDRFVKAVKVETRLMGYGDFVVGQKGNIFSSLVIGHQTQHLLTGRRRNKLFFCTNVSAGCRFP